MYKGGTVATGTTAHLGERAITACQQESKGPRGAGLCNTPLGGHKLDFDTPSYSLFLGNPPDFHWSTNLGWNLRPLTISPDFDRSAAVGRLIRPHVQHPLSRSPSVPPVLPLGIHKISAIMATHLQRPQAHHTISEGTLNGVHALLTMLMTQPTVASASFRVVSGTLTLCLKKLSS